MGSTTSFLVKDNHGLHGGVTPALEGCWPHRTAPAGESRGADARGNSREALRASPFPDRILSWDNMRWPQRIGGGSRTDVLGALPLSRTPPGGLRHNLDLERGGCGGPESVWTPQCGGLTHSAPVSDLSLSPGGRVGSEFERVPITGMRGGRGFHPPYRLDRWREHVGSGQLWDSPTRSLGFHSLSLVNDRLKLRWRGRSPSRCPARNQTPGRGRGGVAPATGLWAIGRVAAGPPGALRLTILPLGVDACPGKWRWRVPPQPRIKLAGIRSRW